MLNLAELFDQLHDEAYCVVKMSQTFPVYEPGNDVDLFCFDPQALSRHILAWLNPQVTADMTVKVTTAEKLNKITIDLMQGDAIHLRFECYGQLPAYKRVAIKPALFERIVEHRTEHTYEAGGTSHVVHVPSLIDEMTLRYLEFIEWYHIRPDKLRHLDYILAKLDEPMRVAFLDQIHYYTQLPRETSELERPSWLKRLRRIFR